MSNPPYNDFDRHAARAGNFVTRMARHLENFWHRVTEGLTVQALWKQFAADARAGYDFYSRDVDFEALRGQSRFKRFVKISRALFLAMLMKLSPARRVVLLLALMFGVLALTGVSQVQVSQGNTIVNGSNNGWLVLLSVGGLLILLALELSDRVVMKRDLEIAREIQTWLVPSAPPEVPGFDIAFASRPANTVGGDYYDAFVRSGAGPDESGRLLVVVADVAGKSVPAALLMATFQASLRTLAARPTALPELVAGMNRYSVEHSLRGLRFTTAFFAEIDPATRALSYVRAGHNPPLLRRASGEMVHLNAGELPLGIRTGQEFSATNLQLASGDLLVIFSDGFVEAENSAQQDFGEERLVDLVKALPSQPAAESLKSLMAQLDVFVGAARQHDDMTLVIVRVL